MALDNRARMSVVCNWIPAFPASVRPIGGLTAKSRQAAAWMYAGVIAQPFGIVDQATELVYAFGRFLSRRSRFTKFFQVSKSFDF